MIKFNRSMAQYLNSERERVKAEKKKSKVELGEYCKQYIKKHTLFDWFIERYFGKAKTVELWNLASANDEDSLRHELNSIWYELPDNIFNIRNNPEGWEEFLWFVEE